MDYDYKASVLKRIDLEEMEASIEGSGHKPQAGDVVAVKITEKRGKYGELDLPGGRLVQLEEGDIVVGAFGNRAGVKGYIGKVPERARQGDEVFFLGSGGLFGEFLSMTKELGKPYRAEFLGFVKHGDELLNTKEFGIDYAEELDEDVRILPVVATRMDAGKTTVAAKLIEQLSDRGYSVASVKLTGSARERDRIKMYESGSQVSLDFVDAGLPSTVDDADRVVRAAKGIVQKTCTDEDIDVVVAEMGAGLISNYHVDDVLRDLDFKERVFAIAATALDVTGAYGLKKLLADMDYSIASVSGPITDTTAGVENVEAEVGVPALNAFRDEDVEELADIVEADLDASF